MDVSFPGPAIPAKDGGISFRAVVDGQTVACKFSTEALQDVKPSLTASPPSTQFEESKQVLLNIAEKKIRSGQVTEGVVRIFTADLRP